MASSQGIRAGRAYVELGTKDSALVKGLHAAEKKLRAFGDGIRSIGTTMAALGAGIVTPLFAASKVFASTGDAIAKMSRRTGVSVESLSELGFAAEQSGADLDTLETGLRKMQKFVVEAASGSQSANEALAHLGLTIANLAQLSPEGQFKLIADRLSQIANPTFRAAMAMEIFGKTGTKLLPLMEGGARGIEELQQQARDLGLTMGTEDARAAEVWTDTMNVVVKVLQKAAFTLGSVLVPTLIDAANWITNVVKRASEWIAQNKALIATVFKVGAVILAGGAALVALGTAISGLGAALGTVAALITGVGTVLGALLSPIGLVIASLGRLATWFLTSTKAGAAALDWLGGVFNDLKETALGAFKGISDALAAGDICLAARILWLTLKMEWQKGINFLQSKWLDFKGFFVGIFQNASFRIARFLTDAWAGIQSGWVETTTFLANTWDSFIGLLQKGWNRFGAFFKSVWARIKGLFGATNADAEIAKINAEVAQQDEEINKKREAAIAERDQPRLEEIERDRTSAQQALDDQQAQAQADREAKHQAALADAEQALAKAREEWQAALDEAAKTRADAGGPARLKKPITDLFTPDELDVALQDVQKKIDVSGTFNAAAVRGLGAESLQERTAKATENVATNTRQLVNQAKQGRLVFQP